MDVLIDFIEILYFWNKVCQKNCEKNTERFKYNVMSLISSIVSTLIVYLSTRLTTSFMALRIIGCLVTQRGQKISKISSNFCSHSNLIRKSTFSLEIKDSRSGFEKIEKILIKFFGLGESALSVFKMVSKINGRYHELKSAGLIFKTIKDILHIINMQAKRILNQTIR